MPQFNRWGVFMCNQGDNYAEIVYRVMVGIPGFMVCRQYFVFFAIFVFRRDD